MTNHFVSKYDQIHETLADQTKLQKQASIKDPSDSKLLPITVKIAQEGSFICPLQPVHLGMFLCTFNKSSFKNNNGKCKSQRKNRRKHARKIFFITLENCSDRLVLLSLCNETRDEQMK